MAGVLDGAHYDVEVTADPADPVVGSDRVRGLLRQYEGHLVLVTPVGPAYTVDPEDSASILALLIAHTDVHGVSDHAPRLLDELPGCRRWHLPAHGTGTVQ